ncbi:MAG: SRPBCC domain-containing protein [Bauldia sp.]
MSAATRPARAVADVSAGAILASVEIAVPPERVFAALTDGSELVRWWGEDGLYRVTKWTVDLRIGGTWRAEGTGSDGKPFVVEGEFLDVDPPRKIVQTWKPGWVAGPATRLTYLLTPIAAGTRLTLRHEGFQSEESCISHGDGWPRVLGWLTRHLTPPAPDTQRYYLARLLPPRPTFMQDMSAEERAMMVAHAAYWSGAPLAAGKVVVLGPVGGPQGGWGMGVLRVGSEEELLALQAKDPAITAGRGLAYENLPLLRAVRG